MSRIVIGGAHRAALLSIALAGSLSLGGPILELRHRRREDDEPQLSPRAFRRLADEKRERARDRAGREARHAEMNERLLRERIARGEDNRADKYLHASARRRRQAEQAALPPLPTAEAGL